MNNIGQLSNEFSECLKNILICLDDLEVEESKLSRIEKDLDGFDEIKPFKKKMNKFIREFVRPNFSREDEAKKLIALFRKFDNYVHRANFSEEFIDGINNKKLKENIRNHYEKAYNIFSRLLDYVEASRERIDGIENIYSGNSFEKNESEIKNKINELDFLINSEDVSDIAKIEEELSKMIGYLSKSKKELLEMRAVYKGLDLKMKFEELFSKRDSLDYYLVKDQLDEYHKELETFKTDYVSKLKGELPSIISFLKRKVDFSFKDDVKTLVEITQDAIQDYKKAF